MIRIENWSVCTHKDNIWTAPEIQVKFLKGTVYGHPVFPDGQEVYTSSLVLLDIPNKIAETRNSSYVLGEIDPEYKQYLETGCESN